MKYLLYVLLLIPFFSNSQIVISKYGKVIYFNSREDIKSERTRIARYIDSVLPKSFNYYVLLDIGIIRNEPVYELGFDNLYGDSEYNDIYKPIAWDYSTIGLRICLYNDSIDQTQIIKLLTYGIDNIHKLKKFRDKQLKKDFYDRQSLTLSASKIKKILK